MNDFERLAEGVLRELLSKVPIIEMENPKPELHSNTWGPDFVIHLQAADRPHTLVCEVKSNGQPRHVKAAILQLLNCINHKYSNATPILIAPYLSPATRALCREKSICFLDFEGNAWITFGGVFIDHMVADKPHSEHRELKSLFRPKSAQMLRIMLREPSRIWRVADLADAAGVSLGHVSNIRKALLDREWAQTTNDGVFLSDPKALLQTWTESYEATAGERIHFYSPLHGSALENAARTALGQTKSGQAAFAAFSAAQWLAPYARTSTHYFYANNAGLETLVQALQLRPVTQGENIIITIPNEDGVLLDLVEPATGAICTSPVQTYLDLSIAGERAKEAAEHLAKEMLKWSR